MNVAVNPAMKLAMTFARHRRRGFALPLVLVTLAAVTILLAAAVTTTWRALRGARLAMRASGVQGAGELAAAEAAARAPADSVPNAPMASRVVLPARAMANNLPELIADGEWIRTAPSVVWLVSRATSLRATHTAPLGASVARTVTVRALRIRAPEWELSAALSTTGPIDSAGARPRLTGSAGPDTSACPRGVSPRAGEWRLLDAALTRQRLDREWAEARARAMPWPATPWSAIPASNDSAWRAAMIASSDSVLTGPRRWRGALLHDGPLRLTGDWVIHGLLVVRGTFDAARAHLRVRGAVLIADDARRPVRLGDADVVWERCAVEMALATLGALRSDPFYAWQAVTP